MACCAVVRCSHLTCTLRPDPRTRLTDGRRNADSSSSSSSSENDDGTTDERISASGVGVGPASAVQRPRSLLLADTSVSPTPGRRCGTDRHKSVQQTSAAIGVVAFERRAHTQRERERERKNQAKKNEGEPRSLAAATTTTTTDAKVDHLFGPPPAGLLAVGLWVRRPGPLHRSAPPAAAAAAAAHTHRHTQQSGRLAPDFHSHL